MTVRRVYLIATLLFISGRAQADEAVCDRGAFREVVAGASASISKLHDQNNKILQERLQSLRAKFNWSETEFLAKAAPLVKDETTASIDQANQDLLAKVQSLEADKATTEAGRCAMLAELKLSMEKVIQNTVAKWDHMLAKTTEAAASSLQAGVTQ
jgi:hypothetical protein